MELPNSCECKPRDKYPGMRQHDIAIWEEFLIKNPGTFQRVWYNVHIGDPSGSAHDKEMMKQCGAYDVSQWCIDVLAETDKYIWVIEVKPNALGGALGQALSYTKLLAYEDVFTKPLRPAVLTDDISPITEKAANLLGVVVFTPEKKL